MIPLWHRSYGTHITSEETEGQHEKMIFQDKTIVKGEGLDVRCINFYMLHTFQ